MQNQFKSSTYWLPGGQSCSQRVCARSAQAEPQTAKRPRKKMGTAWEWFRNPNFSMLTKPSKRIFSMFYWLRFDKIVSLLIIVFQCLSINIQLNLINFAPHLVATTSTNAKFYVWPPLFNECLFFGFCTDFHVFVSVCACVLFPWTLTALYVYWFALHFTDFHWFCPGDWKGNWNQQRAQTHISNPWKLKVHRLVTNEKWKWQNTNKHKLKTDWKSMDIWKIY